MYSGYLEKYTSRANTQLTPITHKSKQFQKLLKYSSPIDLTSIASSTRK